MNERESTMSRDNLNKSSRPSYDLDRELCRSICHTFPLIGKRSRQIINIANINRINLFLNKRQSYIYHIGRFKIPIENQSGYQPLNVEQQLRKGVVRNSLKYLRNCLWCEANLPFEQARILQKESISTLRNCLLFRPAYSFQTQAPQAQNIWCILQLVYFRELYGKITNRKKKLCKYM